MHLERHERLNEVKRQMPKEEMDEALKLTTDAALKMVIVKALYYSNKIIRNKKS